MTDCTTSSKTGCHLSVSSPSTGSIQRQKFNMGEFPSGQRGQTVNLLRFASMVRIRPPPPQKRPVHMNWSFLWWRGRKIRTHLNATVRWTVAAASSKTGGFLSFSLSLRGKNANRIPHPILFQMFYNRKSTRIPMDVGGCT